MSVLVKGWGRGTCKVNHIRDDDISSSESEGDDANVAVPLEELNVGTQHMITEELRFRLRRKEKLSVQDDELGRLREAMRRQVFASGLLQPGQSAGVAPRRAEIIFSCAVEIQSSGLMEEAPTASPRVGDTSAWLKQLRKFILDRVPFQRSVRVMVPRTWLARAQETDVV
ncbi:T. brucei spp.-specific protein [Trypanosoma brucei gambiense DAL972]|uniref:T. brucei spp.-specific protein n=1 Tax=Trypanosoma brucei gambiense (strain MHOM/CI/86/DAL972) TaxID=679716 RepID=C9ZN07_TRYB9|nr:T. brucei spp.-specific protein [Trypanosoma brucei gambiense DAL972]CBH10661.1 T. brucei spp.-specific protein [Trypanosoma brucei gambiense DAL972]|eukprot:XP_011772949.1 T. brucei spp.-specific protein [Trypanosoma brucei gambiense DAL972]